MWMIEKTEMAAGERGDVVITIRDLAEARDELDVKKTDLNLTEAKVIIEGKSTSVEKANKESITVKAPSGLGEGPWTIVVITKSDKILDVLNYDPKEKKFLELEAEILEEEEAEK
jgi:hypothetical protein